MKALKTSLLAVLLVASLFSVPAVAETINPVKFDVQFADGSIVGADGVLVRDFSNTGLTDIKINLRSSFSFPDGSTSYTGDVDGYSDSWVMIKVNQATKQASMTVNLHVTAAAGIVSSNYFIEADMFVTSTDLRGTEKGTYFRNKVVDSFFHSNIFVKQVP